MEELFTIIAELFATGAITKKGGWIIAGILAIGGVTAFLYFTNQI